MPFSQKRLPSKMTILTGETHLEYSRDFNWNVVKLNVFYWLVLLHLLEKVTLNVEKVIFKMSSPLKTL